MMLGKCRKPGQATALFKTMLSERLRLTVDVDTALVGAYGYSGSMEEALATVGQVKGAVGYKPDEYTFYVFFNCCCKLRRFDSIPAILDEMSYLGLECNSVIHNAIIDGYGKAGMLEEMESTLSSMLKNGNNVPDTYTMNSIIWVYGNQGRADEMEKWYNEFELMDVLYRNMVSYYLNDDSVERISGKQPLRPLTCLGMGRTIGCHSSKG